MDTQYIWTPLASSTPVKTEIPLSPEYTVSVAQGPQITIYKITEDELTMLADGKRDALKEFMWAMLALATGALPSAGPAIYFQFIHGSPRAMGPGEGLQVAMLIAGGVLAVGAAVVVRSRGKKNESLIDSIRKRRV